MLLLLFDINVVIVVVFRGKSREVQQ